MEVYTIKGIAGLANTYILPINNREIVLVDPADFDKIKDSPFEFQSKLCYTFLTHEHWDHIAALNQLRRMYNTTTIATEKCNEGTQSEKLNLSRYISLYKTSIGMLNTAFVCMEADVTFNGYERLAISNIYVELYETPGHSRGSCCIKINNCLFTGDAILDNMDDVFGMPRHDIEKYQDVTVPILKQLALNNKDLIIYPGHGNPLKLSDAIRHIDKYMEGRYENNIVGVL